MAALLVGTGFVLVAIDPAANGFGILTLWLAPPLLLAGFLLPILGIMGVEKARLNFRRFLNPGHLAGFLCFGVAFVVYILTLEPTASLWDCSEFIASAYKLQVPHTPGTPLSLLMGRLFAMLAFGDVGKVAFMVNLMSAFFSALGIFLLYNLILILGRALTKEKSRNAAHLIAASCGGALVLAFSDTYWFSAVEAETYGPASFFLLLLVWLVITGMDLTGDERSRRMILIFYVAGLGYCIHPMCLLALTLLPYAALHRRDVKSIRRTAVLFFSGLALVFFISRLAAVGMFEFVFELDLFAVNRLRLPFYSGVVIFLTIFIGISRYLLRYRGLQNYVMSAVFLVAGFTPYLLLFIRSSHNPPIDESNPQNLPMIKAYMNRESYPTAPLLYGPYFDARITAVDVKKRIFYKGANSYSVAGTVPEYRYDSRQTLLPRLYSSDPNHIRAYRSWLGMGSNERPDFGDNLKFMVTYQLGHMYFRYLLWNFAGRESDVQDSGWLKPWQGISAPPFEHARNQYWMIAFLLGVVGAVFQYRWDRRGFVLVTILFLITGPVLALYLNSPPVEPRERDYIYVGSFIAFSVWVGIGLLAVAGTGGRIGRTSLYVLSIAVPSWMLFQNYDDHDRSARTFQVDNARNILQSCAPNSILFTGGDNDTFPLWYLQEVEGIRTDVRVMVLSYMNTDWYINQLRNTYYDSGAFKLTLDADDYRQYGPNDVLYVQETVKGAIDFGQYLKLLKDRHPALRAVSNGGEPYHILPSRTIRVSASDSAEEVVLHIDGNYLQKNMLAILDLAISNNWERPIYFNFTSLNSLDSDVSRYVIQEGPVFRLRPQLQRGESIEIDTSLAYRNLLVNADYSNLADSRVYFSYEDHFARMIVPLRQAFNDLARAFMREGNATMALRVMQHAMKKLYLPHLPPSYTNIEAAEIILALDERASARSLSEAVFDYYDDRLKRERMQDRTPSNLDLYLLRRSAELISEVANN